MVIAPVSAAGVLMDGPGNERFNTGVVFTGAAWHSGSTLLGLMLGAHPEVFYCGEAMCVQHFNDSSAALYLRVCRLCGESCPIWSGVSTGAEQDLYETLARRAGRPIVFDSSKSVSWVASQAAALRGVLPLRLLVLVRDGRAVVNSHLRKRPDIPVEEHAAAWVRKMRKVEGLARRWPGAVHRVRYEELATRPEPTSRALADFLEVAFDPAMLDPWHSDPHPLDSNPGPLLLLQRERGRSTVPGVLDPDQRTRDWYGSHPRAIRLDLRWRHELSADALVAFERVAGETNRAYSWE